MQILQTILNLHITEGSQCTKTRKRRNCEQNLNSTDFQLGAHMSKPKRGHVITSSDHKVMTDGGKEGDGKSGRNLN